MRISNYLIAMLAVGGAQARADEAALSTGFGVAPVLGGGVTAFTGSTMRGDTRAGGEGGVWDVRTTIGSHEPLALDLGYVGASTNTKGLFAGQDATIVGTAVEAALRFNILPHATWNPYAFAGVGWQRYDLTGGMFVATSVMNTSDNSIVVPMGVGVEYRDPDGFVFDMCGTFRVNRDAGFVHDTPGSTAYAPMDSWAASVSIGYEL